MLENSEQSVHGVRTGKSGPLERAELANQARGFSIPNYSYCLRKPYANWANLKLNKIRNFLYLSAFLCFFVYKYTYSILLGATSRTFKRRHCNNRLSV